MKTRAADEDGAALMLSMWALFLLSAVILAWILDINSKITLSAHANRLLEAEAMAFSGAEVARHPSVKPDSPLLAVRRSDGQSYEVHITGEGGRLNINFLLAGENPTKIEIFRRYLETKGVDLNERERMIDSLLDWVDPDNLIRLNGAEDGPGYHARNGPLQRIDELKRVRGWSEFTSSPDWDSDFTLNNTGPVDLAWASRDILLALPGMSEAVVDRFLELRQGPDGIDGTSDDPFKTLEDVRGALGFSPQQSSQLAGLVGFNDPTRRIVSIGRSRNATHVVRMVLSQVAGGQNLLSWQEW